MICNNISQLQSNVQVAKIRSARKTCCSCGVVCKGELDEMSPLSIEIIPWILQGPTRMGL
jgi:hypothetical protein